MRGHHQAAALQMALRSCHFTHQLAAVHDVASPGHRAGDNLRPALLAPQDHPRAHIHVGTRLGNQDGVEPGQAVCPQQSGSGIHLQAAHRLHADIVGEIDAALLHGDAGPGAHRHVLGPVVHHDEGDGGVLLHIELGHPDMHPALDTVPGGTAGDDVELRTLFSDDDIVHVLDQTLLGDIEAGLNRPDRLHSGQRPDEITVFLVQFRPGSVHIRVHIHILPVVVLKPVIFCKRLGDADHFQAVLTDAGVDHRVILLNVGAGTSLAGDVDTGLEHVLLLGLGQLLQVGQVIVWLTQILVEAKIDLFTKSSFFNGRILSSCPQFVRHLTPSSSIVIKAIL